MAISADRNIVHKETQKKLKYMSLCTVIHEIYDYTANNWIHRNSNRSFKETFESHTGKTFNRFTKQDRCTWNITHNTGNNAVRNLRTEQWGLAVVREKSEEKRLVTRDNKN